MPGHCQLQNKLSFKTKRGEYSTASHDYKVAFASKPGLLHPGVVPWSKAESCGSQREAILSLRLFNIYCHFHYHELGEGATAIWWVGTLLNILQYRGHLPSTTRNYPAQNINSTKAEKPWCNEYQYCLWEFWVLIVALPFTRHMALGNYISDFLPSPVKWG